MQITSKKYKCLDLFVTKKSIQIKKQITHTQKMKIPRCTQTLLAFPWRTLAVHSVTLIMYIGITASRYPRKMNQHIAAIRRPGHVHRFPRNMRTMRRELGNYCCFTLFKVNHVTTMGNIRTKDLNPLKLHSPMASEFFFLLFLF